MASVLVNLTLLKLNDELELFAAVERNRTFQQVLSNSELRTHLIAYVLNKMPNLHAAIDEEEVSLFSCLPMIFSQRETLELRRLIIEAIMKFKPDEFQNYAHAVGNDGYHDARIRWL